MRTTHLAALAAIVVAGCARPDPRAALGDGAVSRALVVGTVEDLGPFPLPPAVAGRAGGQSGLIGDEILWTFGDTFATMQNAVEFWPAQSATAGWSRPVAPLALDQNLADGAPAQLIPYTADELVTNQQLGSGYVLRPAAVIDTGAPAGLVSFQHMRRAGLAVDAPDGIGTARIAPGETVATRAPGFLFAAPEPLFQPQVALGDSVYALECEPDGVVDQGCKLARAPIAQAEQRAAYEFFDGTRWGSVITNAAVVIDRAGNPPSITFNAYLGRYLSVTCEVASSTVLLRTAAAPEGPWGEATEIAAGPAGVLAPPGSPPNDSCVEHPELAAADGSSIVISYSRRPDVFHPEVRLARVTLQ